MDVRQSRAAERNKNSAYGDRVRPKGIKMTPKFESQATEWHSEKLPAWWNKEIAARVDGW